MVMYLLTISSLKSYIIPSNYFNLIRLYFNSKIKLNKQNLNDNKNDNVVYILDGTAMLYRSYYGMESKKKFSNMKTSLIHGNIPCSALIGLTTTFTRFLREFKPKYIAVAFDSGKTFRNELFPEYKQQREKVIYFY